ncbi:hypothetical protein [Burkholderia metallica]
MDEIRLDAYPPAVPAEMDTGVYRVAGAGRLTSSPSQPIVSWKLLIQIACRLHETGTFQVGQMIMLAVTGQTEMRAPMACVPVGSEVQTISTPGSSRAGLMRCSRHARVRAGVSS